jgi:alkanesulfonate monooxygenase SsuD/methylene tetrahydromethanopterin reductase-like flavin-dependent oxidoreductase (luciferase family)
MELGYGLITCQRYPGDPRTDADLYREALQIAAEVEELGFDSVWTSEHHFADDAYMPSLLPLSAGIAARTSTIRIGTGLLLAPIYPPLRLAEDVATVDLISGGRFVLGLGLGWLRWEFEAFGVPYEERASRLERAISTCRQAWGDGVVGDAGVAVHPKPAHAGGPPIWLGAHVEKAVRRASRLADGFMASEPSADEFRMQVGWLRDEAERAGRSPDELTIAGYWPTFVWEDGDAWEVVKSYQHYSEWKYEDSMESKGRLGPLPSPPPLDAETEATIRAPMICGTPDEVTERIRELADIAAPRFHFVARLYYAGMPLDTMRESTRLFAERVAPALREETA